ncbi:MAG: type II toxin-antitoxin system RelE/ParE family toxin [Magnetococcus sp. YQC-5]
MPYIIQSPRAEEDLEEIWYYIAKDNITRANEWVNAITHTFNRIAEQPKIGKARPELENGVRCLPTGNYLILYKPVKCGIEIYRILHGARDVGKAWNT